MSALGKFMAAQPIFTLFLCLFLGYLLGMLKFGKSFKLGNVVGVLIVGLIIGQIVVWPQKQTAVLGSIFFDAFMFAVGYRVGPQFISSLKKFGAKVVIESFVFLILAFLTSWICFIVFHVKPGVAAGCRDAGAALIGGEAEVLSLVFWLNLLLLVVLKPLSQTCQLVPQPRLCTTHKFQLFTH